MQYSMKALDSILHSGVVVGRHSSYSNQFILAKIHRMTESALAEIYIMLSSKAMITP